MKTTTMKMRLPATIAMAGLVAISAVTLTLPTSQADADIASVSMHRLYNPNSGEHFYTSDDVERNILVDAGWAYEGIGWIAPTEGEDVHRLYNPYAGDHHYTLSDDERNMLVDVGWSYEGVGWKSDGDVPLYREYNPNAETGSHNYTTDEAERENLIDVGWQDEGIAWYGVAEGETDGDQLADSNATATEPQKQQVWVPDIVTVVDQEAWDEPVYETQYVQGCSICGPIEGDAIAHMDAHWSKGEGASTGTQAITVQTGTIHHDAVTHEEDHGHYEYV